MASEHRRPARAGERSERGGEQMSTALSVVWDEAFLGYRLSPDHPLHPIRLALTVDLSRSLGVLDAPHVTVVAPEPADDDLLRLVHSAAYLDAVRAAPEDPAGAF